MTITAKFIGEDGAHGYRQEQDYTLLVNQFSNLAIIVQRRDRSGAAKFVCLADFLKQWASVQFIAD